MLKPRFRAEQGYWVTHTADFSEPKACLCTRQSFPASLSFAKLALLLSPPDNSASLSPSTPTSWPTLIISPSIAPPHGSSRHGGVSYYYITTTVAGVAPSSAMPVDRRCTELVRGFDAMDVLHMAGGLFQFARRFTARSSVLPLYAHRFVAGAANGASLLCCDHLHSLGRHHARRYAVLSNVMPLLYTAHPCSSRAAEHSCWPFRSA